MIAARGAIAAAWVGQIPSGPGEALLACVRLRRGIPVPTRVHIRAPRGGPGSKLENYRFSSLGGQLFDAAQAIGAGAGDAAESGGICWITMPADRGVPRFLLRTKFGLEEIATLEHLQLRLGLVTPGPLPESDAARGGLLRIV